MTTTIFKCSALLIALIAPLGAYAEDDNTSPPGVVVPQTTPAPQTPAFPSPPIGANNFAPAAPTVRSAPSPSSAPIRK
jgi:hypothetical protein